VKWKVETVLPKV